MLDSSLQPHCLGGWVLHSLCASEEPKSYIIMPVFSLGMSKMQPTNFHHTEQSYSYILIRIIPHIDDLNKCILRFGICSQMLTRPTPLDFSSIQL